MLLAFKQLSCVGGSGEIDILTVKKEKQKHNLIQTSLGEFKSTCKGETYFSCIEPDLGDLGDHALV